MTIQKTPNGRWRAIVKSGRQAVATKTFDLKRDAETWHDAQKRALALGDYVDPKAGRVTVGEAMQTWLAAREGTVAGSTFTQDSQVVTALPHALTGRPVNAVRVTDLEAHYGALLRSGQARGTVSRLRDTLSAFYTWAMKQGMVSKHPVRESRVPTGMATDAKHEVWPFTYDELIALHTELHHGVQDKAAADILLVLGLTGLRWGELAALRVRDVQLVPYPAFRVSRSRPDGQAVRNVTKGGKPRTVPLTAEVVAIVEPLLAGAQPDAPVFPNEAGQMRLLSNWKRATHWEVNSRGRRVHDLRHTAATLWLSNGIDLKTAQTWLGHSTAKLTADTYAHWMGTDADAAAIAKLNAKLGNAGGTRKPNLNVLHKRAGQ